jgi:hypothetical protein
MSGYVDVTALRNKARESFISKRTIQEQQFDKWYKGLLACPKEKVLDKIPFDYTTLSLRTLVPEWYVEVPNQEICDQQIAEANAKIDIINKIISDINGDGVRLLEEYNALYSR